MGCRSSLFSIELSNDAFLAVERRSSLSHSITPVLEEWKEKREENVVLISSNKMCDWQLEQGQLLI